MYILYYNCHPYIIELYCTEQEHVKHNNTIIKYIVLKTIWGFQGANIAPFTAKQAILTMHTTTAIVFYNESVHISEVLIMRIGLT